ncbi:sigma-54-dependent transcriptional regulator [Sporomusa acidovorans]|uniref:Regulatory protein AtoC n=1 Tax=Sporomusa acidovorans (strain ATCC 49682 / DSM 3132 / Mol) TaxID=1123286 RepID=A0ABZ3J9Q5_SPOA4|nr:sigma-54 dependent transcriptional regulator [Sporomusa acidovorans]OZC21773.1 transcriptional regulatory protein QseF [Sporomusa acidovorans DSM 3132]SDD57284.1 two component, sigma54 specific, transcriptional regulator, Fis family [Sporomusa acidovorans]
MDSILIIDDEPEMARGCARLLKPLGLECLTAFDGEQGVQIIKEKKPAVVLTDLSMPEFSGMDVLTAVQDYDPGILVLIVTGYATIPAAVAAIQGGAFDFIAKPFSGEQLRVVVKRALTQKRLTEENRRLRCQVEALTRSEQVIGNSPALMKLFKMVKKVAPTDLNVLILGESGTGKEVFARSLHENSLRCSQPFIPVDCAAMPHDLLESELFGYEKGAFTGAVQAKPGLLEMAHGGTLFLDELGELDLHLQAKLLRVLEERSFRRLGGTRFIQVDIRILSATNRDLPTAIQEKRFREDLYYRLNVITMTLPPLRERTGDIPLLTHHFLARFNEKSSKKISGFSREAMHALESYSWPGNVRELKNMIVRAAVLAEGEYITLMDLPGPISQGTSDPGLNRVQGAEELLSVPFLDAKAQMVEAFERSYLQALLERYRSNVSRAAAAAGIDRKTIQRMMKKYNLVK